MKRLLLILMCTTGLVFGQTGDLADGVTEEPVDEVTEPPPPPVTEPTPPPTDPPPSFDDCEAKLYAAFPMRMQHWFSTIMRSQGSVGQLNYRAMDFMRTVHSYTDYQRMPVVWRFCSLDTSYDEALNEEELDAFSSPFEQYEPCYKHFIEECDENSNGLIELDEWIQCITEDPEASQNASCEVFWLPESERYPEEEVEEEAEETRTEPEEEAPVPVEEEEEPAEPVELVAEPEEVSELEPEPAEVPGKR